MVALARVPGTVVALASALALALAAGAARAAEPARDLEEDLGRNETRVRSAAFEIGPGASVLDARLVERLERLGYRRVSRAPERPGEFFFGYDVFRVWRRAHRYGGRDHPAESLALALDRATATVVEGTLRLPPETLAESLDGDRARRVPLRLDALPERVWRPLLALEDARFFDHRGLDGRALARALLANLRSGDVEQGGSTLTQQLIKARELSPKRTLGRKASEALRALALEADYTKEEILETYLNHVYLGHVDGLAVHGYGAAARVYFSRDAEDLDLPRAAALAAMVQGPNRLSPQRHADALRARRDRALTRMEELGWIGAAEARAARAAPLGADPAPPRRPPAPDFLSLVRERVDAEAGGRLDRGRGVVVETTLDPVLQEAAEEAVAAGLRDLRRSGAVAALVALDARSGDVLAYVGGDPAAPDGFDRAGDARRQPGSAIKPLLLLEALEDCGSRPALHAATRISDAPWSTELEGGRRWSPQNFDRRNRGVVSLRDALVHSYNLPFARIVEACGAGPTADRLRRAGIAVPDPPPPSFALGAVETTPLALAEAFTVFAGDGRRAEARALTRVERPAGGRLHRRRPDDRRVVGDETAWLIRDLLRDAVERGTGRPARIGATDGAWGKTGTSSDLRDAWFAGGAGAVVAAVWVGRDAGDLGRTGSEAAAPIWARFMETAARVRPGSPAGRPSRIVRLWIDPDDGLAYGERKRGTRPEWFRRGAAPRRDRFWRPDPAEPVLE